VKRALDVVLGTMLVLLVLPAILFAAVGSALVLRTWPFFVQTRVGAGGREFRFFKIRTLPKTVGAYVDKYQLNIGALPWFTRKLRLLHLDELPQLLLVPLGKMSLVGPRPEMPSLHGTMSPDHRDTRVAMRPGCTGLWQVSVDCDRLISEAPEYDVFYVANSNIRLDLWIIARTVRMMLLGGPLVTLSDVPTWAQRDRVISLDEPDRALEGAMAD
jgi:lipopolysaccharide/colanic/teichoic acid biosynthesis glycosyltransferase